MTQSRIEPDTKDWTWVLDRPCPECGYVAGDVGVEVLAEQIRDNATAWEALLQLPLPALRTRPDPTAWSALEYACHVRDVHRVFSDRVALMLEHDDPTFDDWDQDATAAAGAYLEQRPARVEADLMAAADAVATAYDGVPPGSWGRRGLRSNGSGFSVATLGAYHLHDVVHHLYDVRALARTATIGAYDDHATAYAASTPEVPERVRSVLDRLLASLQPGDRVLEIGSGPGRDAAFLERGGLRVRRTDVSAGFVEVMRAAGHEADLLDPLTDDLAHDFGGPGTYDAVLANACLLHVARTDLPVVLARLATVTRPGGLLQVSLKEGDGELWSTHGSVAAPRHFTLWREGPLVAALTGAGWAPLEIGHGLGQRGDLWIDVLARRTGERGDPA